ncbi:hypothetical protein BG004_003589 [Podila humilis]|nr:hypothetical protein BG004_003589 [Podila humilis]
MPTSLGRHNATTILDSSRSQRVYNILFLGETQAGKSTLIEALRKYANPKHTINTKNIGDGTFSFTTDTRLDSIVTNLPSCSVVRKHRDGTVERIDHREFIEQDFEDYEDELNDRRSYDTEETKSPQSSLSEPIMTTFNLIDTPGLNNTTSTDKASLDHIFRRLRQDSKVLHLDLVVMTVSSNPFTQDLKNALRTSMYRLNDLKQNLVFVHTKVDYAKLHPSDVQFTRLTKEKKELLHGLMATDSSASVSASAPHFMIDNDLGSIRTIRNCITMNTLRDLLKTAMENKPIPAQLIPDAKIDSKLLELTTEESAKINNTPTICHHSAAGAVLKQDSREENDNNNCQRHKTHRRSPAQTLENPLIVPLDTKADVSQPRTSPSPAQQQQQQQQQQQKQQKYRATKSPSMQELMTNHGATDGCVVDVDESKKVRFQHPQDHCLRRAYTYPRQS